MANIVSTTVWHGNPRPITSYVTTVFDDGVVSPYYAVNMAPVTVPVHKTYNTPVPLASLIPTATIQEAGPSPIVGWEMNGLWRAPTQLQVAITVTGGTDISTSIAFSTDLLSPSAAAAQVVGALNLIGNGEIIATAVDQEVYIETVAPATSLTITTLTVV